MSSLDNWFHATSISLYSTGINPSLMRGMSYAGERLLAQEEDANVRFFIAKRLAELTDTKDAYFTAFLSGGEVALRQFYNW
jgi:hypothetical protein